MLNWNVKLCYLTILMHDFCFSTVHLKKKNTSRFTHFCLASCGQKEKKNQVRALWKSPLCSSAALHGNSQTHTVSGSLFGAPPCRAAHLPGSIMVRLMQAETSITRAEAETTAGNTKERTGQADAGHNRPALLQVSLLWFLPWWQFDGCTWGDMGLHTCLHARLHNIYGVYA